MRKKIISLAMSFIMVVTFMPAMAVSSFADTSVAVTPAETTAVVYEEVDLSQLNEGDRCIIAYPGNSHYYAMTSSLDNRNRFTRASVDMTDGEITDPGAAAVWTVGIKEEEQQEQQGHRRLSFCNNGNYIALNNSKRLTLSNEAYFWTQEDGAIKSEGRYLTYSSSSFTVSDTKSILHFHKETTASNRQITVIPVRGAWQNNRNVSLIRSGKLKITIRNTSTEELTFSLHEENTGNVTFDKSTCTIPAGEEGVVRITANEHAKAAHVIITADKPVSDPYKAELHINIIDTNADDDPDSDFRKGTNLAVTSDVHGSLEELDRWQQRIKDNTKIQNPQKMIFCGDYSYESDLAAELKDFSSVISITNANFGANSGIYTSGNHEYQSDMGNELSPLFEKNNAFKRIGWAVDPAKKNNKYGVYCLGAAGWYDAVGTYPEEDINALDKALAGAPNDEPIFIAAHFPLHAFGSRETTNALKMIKVLNQYPNVIFLWGHNHSQEDTRYGQVTPAGESLNYASGRSKKINFTYACAGAMHDGQSIAYRGMIANIKGSCVTMQYFDYDGKVVSEATTVIASGNAEEDAGEDVLEIDNNTSQIEKTVNISQKSFILDILNGPISTSSRYGSRTTPPTEKEFSVISDNAEIATVELVDSTVTVEPTSTAETASTAEVKIPAYGFDKFKINLVSPGNTNIKVSRGNTQFATIKLVVLNEDGTAVPDDSNIVVPSTSNPTVKKNLNVGDTVEFAITNTSTNSSYIFYITNDSPDVVSVSDEEAGEEITTSSEDAEDVADVEDEDNEEIKIEIPKGGSKKITVTGLNDGKSRISITNNNGSYARKATISITVGKGAETLKYLAIGDSIGAGVKGGYGGDSSEYNAYNTYGSKGEKNWNVYAVSYSYVNKFATEINADSEVSWNGTAAGYRAKEICYMLDLPAYKGDGYNYDLSKVTWEDLEKVDFDFTKLDIDDYYGWAMGSRLSWNKMFRQINKEEYKKAVKKADVITIELGANEFNAFAMYGPLTNKILPALKEAIEKTKSIGNYEAANELQESYEQIADIMQKPDEIGSEQVNTVFQTLKDIKRIAGNLVDVSISYRNLIKELTKSFDYAYKSFRYYWKTLLTHIRKVNPDAAIIVTSVPNPLDGMNLSGMNLSQMGLDLGGLDISNLNPGDLVKPFITDMNNYIKNNAQKYRYSIADISGVSLNPKKEDGTPDPAYSFHPNNEGHDQIFEAVRQAYPDAVEKSESVLRKIINSVKDAISKLFGGTKQQTK